MSDGLYSHTGLLLLLRCPGHQPSTPSAICHPTILRLCLIADLAATLKTRSGRAKERGGRGSDASCSARLFTEKQFFSAHCCASTANKPWQFCMSIHLAITTIGASLIERIRTTLGLSIYTVSQKGPSLSSLITLTCAPQTIFIIFGRYILQ